MLTTESLIPSFTIQLTLEVIVCFSVKEVNSPEQTCFMTLISLPVSSTVASVYVVLNKCFLNGAPSVLREQKNFMDSNVRASGTGNVRINFL